MLVCNKSTFQYCFVYRFPGLHILFSNPLNMLFYFLRKVWSHPWSAKSPEPNSWAFCTNNARLNSHPAASHRAALSPICKRVEFAFQLPRAKELSPLSLHTCLASSWQYTKFSCLALSVPKRHEGHGGTVGSITCKIAFAAHQTWM